MTRKKRLFVAFAIEDEKFRNLLRGQAANGRRPFDFIDMSAKEPWDEKWKTNCRTRIKGCDGAIVLVSKNLAAADGALWEVQCAIDEGVRTRGLYTTADNRPSGIPNVLATNKVTVVDWTDDNLAAFIDSL